jgi:hypothetical protein
MMSPKVQSSIEVNAWFRPSLRVWLWPTVFVAMTAFCLAVSLTPDPDPPFVAPPGATSDLDVFRRIVERVRVGDGYYDASQQELRSHGYPTRSVFNWRTPVFAWLLTSPPGEPFWKGMLMAAALASVLIWCRAMLEESGLFPASVCGVTLVGATAWCTGAETILFGEVWAGILILSSLSAYLSGWRRLAFALGLFAVFYRELALPYAAVCLGMAAWHGRRREAIAWLVGLVLFAAFLAMHAHQVHTRLTDRDLAIARGWVRFGGVCFLLRTAQTNVFLMPLPLWCTAIYLPLAVLGLAGARGPEWTRVGLTGGLYFAAFSMVGNPFNFYWGFVYAPVLALGFARSPVVLRSWLAADRSNVLGGRIPDKPGLVTRAATRRPMALPVTSWVPGLTSESGRTRPVAREERRRVEGTANRAGPAG